MSESRPLADHRSLIVGASSGIGRASAEALVADGAHVTLAGRREDKLIAVADALAPLAKASGGSLDVVTCDASDGDQVKAAVTRASGGVGLDSALAVPGGGGYSPVLGYDVEDFMGTIDTNVRPAYTILKHAGLEMIRTGGGSFIAVSSTAAVFSSPYLAAYCAAKAAVDMLVRVAADECGRHGLRVNAVRPGLTETGATGGMMSMEPILEQFLDEQPLRRPGEAMDQARMVRFLAGPESSWITGQCYTVDGGHTLRKFPDLEGFARSILGDAPFDAVARGEDPAAS